MSRSVKNTVFTANVLHLKLMLFKREMHHPVNDLHVMFYDFKMLVQKSLLCLCDKLLIKEH